MKNCLLCNTSLRNAKTFQTPLIASQVDYGPWEKLHLDIVGPLQNTEARYMFVLVDEMSKWPEVANFGSITTENVVHFLKSVFARFGTPRVLVTDNGTQLTSHAFEECLRRNSITHVRTPLYNPSSNGLVERFNKTLKFRIKEAFALQLPLENCIQIIEPQNIVLQEFHHTKPC